MKLDDIVLDTNCLKVLLEQYYKYPVKNRDTDVRFQANKGRFLIQQFKAFIDQPPVWFVIAAVEKSLYEYLLEISATVKMPGRDYKKIEWADAIHYATALLFTGKKTKNGPNKTRNVPGKTTPVPTWHTTVPIWRLTIPDRPRAALSSCPSCPSWLKSTILRGKKR